MTGLDIVQSVQFVTVKGKRLAVLSAYGRKQNKFCTPSGPQNKFCTPSGPQNKFCTPSGPSKFINMTLFLGMRPLYFT